MFTQWWLIVKKKEMTRVLINDKLTPVTIVSVLPQEVVRQKTDEKDWYTALVVGIKDKKGESYKKQKEFNIDPTLIASYPAGHMLNETLFDGVTVLAVQGISKGKWFAWVIKRHHMHGMPATHGHKFTRVGWSKGNRKPRRTQKWHPHAWHMGDDLVTLKKIPLLQTLRFEQETLLVLKWSIPGSYNSYIYLYK